METGKYFYVKHVKCAGCGARRTYTGEGLRMQFNPQANWKLLLACSARCAEKFVNKTKTPAKPKVVCTTCNDTHYMNVDERHVMCTQCPIPCEGCCGPPSGAFCEYTPCFCECHKSSYKKVDKIIEPDMLMTRKGPIPYREITQTHERT